MAKRIIATFPVQFGGVNYGDATVRIGITVDRTVLNINAADDLFSSRRLEVTIAVGDFDPNQRLLFKDAELKADAVADVKTFSTDKKKFTTGLTFVQEEIDDVELKRFAKKKGIVVVRGVKELAEKSTGGKDDDENEEDEDDE